MVSADDLWLTEVKWIRVQIRSETESHTMAEFVNGSMACSCGLCRGTTPSLRAES